MTDKSFQRYTFRDGIFESRVLASDARCSAEMQHHGQRQASFIRQEMAGELGNEGVENINRYASSSSPIPKFYREELKLETFPTHIRPIESMTLKGII